MMRKPVVDRLRPAGFTLGVIQKNRQLSGAGLGQYCSDRVDELRIEELPPADVDWDEEDEAEHAQDLGQQE